MAIKPDGAAAGGEFHQVRSSRMGRRQVVNFTSRDQAGVARSPRPRRIAQDARVGARMQDGPAPASRTVAPGSRRGGRSAGRARVLTQTGAAVWSRVFILINFFILNSSRQFGGVENLIRFIILSTGGGVKDLEKFTISFTPPGNMILSFPQLGQITLTLANWPPISALSPRVLSRMQFSAAKAFPTCCRTLPTT